MNIYALIGSIHTSTFASGLGKPSTFFSYMLLHRPSCTRKNRSSGDDDPQSPKRDGEANGDKSATDWDKAWSIYKKKGKKPKSLFPKFSPSKYVTYNPKRPNYPLSEEVDPIKRTERSALMFWTGSGFTLVGAIVIVSFLLIYTILSPIPPK